MMKLTTQCGGFINVSSQALEHLLAHPEITEDLLREAVGKITLPTNGSYLNQAIEMNRSLGKKTLSDEDHTCYGDKVLFTYRKGRDLPSRIVIKDITENCSTIVIAAKINAEGNGVYGYSLVTAFVGIVAPPEPFTPRFSDGKFDYDFDQSISFWQRHALIYDGKSMGSIFESTWEEMFQKHLRDRSGEFRKFMENPYNYEGPS